MSCNNCGRSPCSCVGSPYYTNACVQDHTLKTYQAQYSFGLCPQSQWNVPLCGGAAVLSIPGVIGVPTGANIWHPQFGYFKIIAVDSIAGTITVTNECPQVEYQATPGTQIPGCTCFAIVPLPYDEQGPNTQVCVAVSFTAPVVDTPTDITLTAITGLQVGDTIQIGSGFYYVDEIKPNNVITIVNQGEGIVPGTPVIAQDVNGNFLNCIQVIETSPCNNPEVDEGSIVACNEDGVLGPLNPATLDSFVYEDDTNVVTFSDPTTSGQTSDAVISVINSSPSRTLHALVTYIGTFRIQSNAGTEISVVVDILRSVDDGAFTTLLPLSQLYTIAADTNGDRQCVATSVETVAPGATLKLELHATMVTLGGSVLEASLTAQIKAIAVSLSL